MIIINHLVIKCGKKGLGIVHPSGSHSTVDVVRYSCSLSLVILSRNVNTRSSNRWVSTISRCLLGQQTLMIIRIS